MPYSWSIRRHLYALVLAVVVPMAILLAYSIQSNVRSHLADASSITLTLAQISAADTQRFVHDAGQVLAGLAKRPKVRALDPANCDALLQDFKEFFPQFANVAIADKSGAVVCSALTSRLGKRASVAGTTWLRQVAEANAYIAGYPHIGPVSGKWVSVLAYPIRDEDGLFIGVVGFPIDLVQYRPLQANVNLPKGTVIRIITSDGTILASSESPKDWVGRKLDDAALAARIREEKHGQAWTGSGLDGTVYGYTPVPGTDWYVVSSVPAATILDDVLANASRNSALLLMLAIIAGFAAYQIGRRIVRPIIDIAGTAKAVATGQLDRRAPVVGPREIKDVAEQFNTMLSVRQRTEEKYRNLLESATDAIVIVNAEGRIIFANGQAENMFGFAHKELVGQQIDVLVPPALRHAHGAKVARFVADPQSRQMAPGTELRAIRKDGREFPVEITLSPLMTDEGLIISAIVRDVSERKRYEERLVYLAQFDALTGLPNRNLLRDRLEQALSRAIRDNKRVGVILIDVDRFQELNDTLGHRAGDALLKAIGERLSAAVPDTATVARPGGDEFIVMEKVHAEGEILLMGETIQEAFTAPFHLDGKDVFLSVSIGISVYPDDGADADTLLKNVDVAMYQAKHDGRNTFRFYAPEMDKRASEHVLIENHLRRALSRNELLLHYQPKVDGRSGRVLGVEALARWENPELGMVPPARFIPVAEETGLIENIGDWILRTACAQNKQWQDDGIPPIVMAVNISATQFRRSDLVRTVCAALEATGLAPQWLELEITESMLMQRPEEAEALLRQLAAMGVGIALDDFGTGYSSLAYVKRFPVRNLKIDRSFVRDIHTDPNDAAIVRTVVSLAKSMELGLVAEGVELREQLDCLAALDCHVYQGYYFSKPVPAESCTSLLRQSLAGVAGNDSP
ncbi:bifunctional diguanylate cyclase/phosphodiesterase [Noviherbaspirillum sp. ST9]|uniref:bifunctional diguanylate cyclase/phosphodiesterase n=1 Tax=Noviherbaspirillum sp. ST9 TaxID=3401606 RepID=UPI003B589C9B